MVNLPSSAAQASDVEQKKRKHTLDRAKANHLSRQLQMRLQYAKLKVDHGWQRQTLDEVENLYFRHSHMRGPRSSANVKSPSHPVLSPAFQLGSSTSVGVGAHQDLSTSTSQPSIVNSRIPGDDVANEHTMDAKTPTPQIPHPPNPTDAAPESSSSLFLTVTSSEMAPVQPETQEPSPSKSVSFIASPINFRAVHHDSQPTSGAATPTKSAKSKARPKSKSKPVVSLSPSCAASSSPYRQGVLPSPIDNEQLSGNGSRQETVGDASPGFVPGKSESAKGVGFGLGLSGAGYGYGSTEMTYDSFWSSHSSASAAVRLGGQ